MILYQPREGALWSTVTARDGAPATIAIGASAATFLAAVGWIHGSYQLVPCDHDGLPRGTPPQRIDLSETTSAKLARFRAPALRRREPQREPQPKPRAVGADPALERLRRRHQDVTTDHDGS